MTGDLAEVAAGLDLDPGAVEYRLRPTGPPLFRDERRCGFCHQAAHREPPRGSACPLRMVPLRELLTDDMPGWLRRERASR